MNELKRRLAYLAVAIHERRRDEPSTVPFVDRIALRMIESKLKLLEAARSKGWDMAATRLVSDLIAQSYAVDSSLANMRTQLATPPKRPPATPRDIFEELVALEQEFGGVEFNKREKWLAVTTEPIELEGVYLGCFCIKAFWDNDAPEYDVIALDPNPAGCNDCVSHPHVDNEKLCAGEATLALRSAWEQRRFADFFLVVRSVLRTYNVDSPYVALADWDGVTCTECGDSAPRDDVWSCGDCSTRICTDCDVRCGRCDELVCSNCTETCTGCERAHCAECLGPCAACSQSCCASCLDEAGHCDACQPSPEPDPQPNTKETVHEPIAPVAAV